MIIIIYFWIQLFQISIMENLLKFLRHINTCIRDVLVEITRWLFLREKIFRVKSFSSNCVSQYLKLKKF